MGGSEMGWYSVQGEWGGGSGECLKAVKVKEGVGVD